MPNGTQVKTETTERRIVEKDEEFAMVRKNQAKALTPCKQHMKLKLRVKAEALRMKKKLEADAADLGLALEHAIAGMLRHKTQSRRRYQPSVWMLQAKG